MKRSPTARVDTPRPSRKRVACPHTDKMSVDHENTVVCTDCGEVLENAVISNNSFLPNVNAKDEELRKFTTSSDSMARLAALERAAQRIDKSDTKSDNKRVRDAMNATKEETIRDEKKRRTIHRESTTASQLFVNEAIELAEPHYSHILIPHRALIESALRSVYGASFIGQKAVAVAYVLHAMIDSSIAVDYNELRFHIEGLSKLTMESMMSRMQAISTSLAKPSSDKAVAASASASASSSSSSSSSSASASASNLHYYSAAAHSSSADRMHSSSVVKQIKLNIVILANMVKENDIQEYTNEHSDLLIQAVRVGTRNLEAIAGAVFYLLIGLNPHAIHIRSFKRIQQAAIHLYELNNAMDEKRRAFLFEQTSKRLPKLAASLAADNGKLLLGLACMLQFGEKTHDEVTIEDYEKDWDAADAMVVANDDRKKDRNAFKNAIIASYPPHGIPSPSEISHAIQNPYVDIHGLCMVLLKHNMLGDPQTHWPNALEVQQMKEHTTGSTMRTVAIEIKQSMAADVREKMRPIQMCDAEHVGDVSRQRLLWAHIEDLASYYMRRMFACKNLSAKMTIATQDVIIDRLKKQCKLTRRMCGTTLFTQEHETIAAALLVSSMTKYFNQSMKIKVIDLYDHNNNICGADVSASTISICQSRLANKNSVLDM